MDHDEERSLSLGTEVSASVPPPSPLTGCYLLAVIGEPHTNEHKEIILQRLVKGLLSWDSNEHQVDLEKELATLTAQAPEGEEARCGERLIQFASENLVTEILIHPQMNTLMQCMRNLLSSFTRHRHLLHAGYTFAGNGSWIMQDGTFSLADFTDAYQENEVQRVIRAYENSISIDIHCSTSGGGDWAKLPEMPFVKHCKIRVNPTDILDSGSQAIKDFISYLNPYVEPASLEQLLVSSDVVGNIRFSHPTLYVFPGGQGDAALFGINGFNMLVDGGFSRKACWWDFARHLDRLDAVLFTRLNNCSVAGMAAVLHRKANAPVYPQIGHFFCNLEERRALTSPDGDKDADPLLVSLLQQGSDLMADLRRLNLRAQHCYRSPEPVNLYHKVGHGTLDMYVLNPSKDSKYVREFLKRWHNSEQKLFEGSSATGPFKFPIPNLVSICALLVWRPANPDDTITRIMFPGSTPQHKIFEGLEKLKHLELLQTPTCTGRQMMASSTPPPPTTVTATKTTKTSTRVSKERSVFSTEKSKDEKIVEPEPPPPKIEPKEITKDIKYKDRDSVKDELDSKNIIDNKLLSELVDGEEKKIESVLQEAITGRVETKLDDKIAHYESAVIDGLPKRKEVKKKVVDKKMKKIDKTEDVKDVVVKSTEARKTETEAKSSDTKLSDAKTRVDSRKKTDIRTKTEKITSSMTRSTTSHKTVQKIDKKTALSTIEKKSTEEKKSPPTTPKKTMEPKITTTSSAAQQTAKERIKIRTRKLSPGSTPAKSTKEAANRRVAESKYKQASPKRDMAQKPNEKKEIKPKREPISRRPRPLTSPVKGLKAMKSPSKSMKSIKTDTKIKGLQRVNYEDILKDAKKSDEDTSKSLDDIKQQELDEKEEQEIVREIEAVFNRDSVVEYKEKEYVGRSDIEKITYMLDDAKTETTADGEFEEEYLIIEKEEVDLRTEDSIGERQVSQEVEDELQKHAKDKEESEKKKEKSPDLVKEKTEEAIELKLRTEEKTEDLKPSESKEHSVSVEEKQDISSEKKTSDSKSGVAKPKDSLELNIVQESQPDEKISTTIESGATTAPTLPEDERIPLDEIKEDQQVEEKYVREDTKEVVPPHTVMDVQKPLLLEKISNLESQPPPAPIREIVKTPDEVADLPLHEEVDYRTYEEKSTPTEDDIFKRKPDIGFVHEIKVPKDLPLPSQEAASSYKGIKHIQDDIVIKTVERPSHPELVTVTPGSAPESPMFPEQKITSVPSKPDLEPVKEYEDSDYNYTHFTEKLRETHITTLDSPIKDDIVIVDDVPCMPEKIPSIPEDVEKEIEEARKLEAADKLSLSPKDIEKIVVDVAEVLKSEKSLGEIIAEKSPTMHRKSPEIFAKMETSVKSAIEATKTEITSEQTMTHDLTSQKDVKEESVVENKLELIVTEVAKEISPARSITSEDGSEASDKTVLSEGKRIKRDIKDDLVKLKQDFVTKEDIEIIDEKIDNSQIEDGDGERKLSVTLDTAKTLEKLEEKMADLKRKEEAFSQRLLHDRKLSLSKKELSPEEDVEDNKETSPEKEAVTGERKVSITEVEIASSDRSDKVINNITEELPSEERKMDSKKCETVFDSQDIQSSDQGKSTLTFLKETDKTVISGADTMLTKITQETHSASDKLDKAQVSLEKDIDTLDYLEDRSVNKTENMDEKRKSITEQVEKTLIEKENESSSLVGKFMGKFDEKISVAKGFFAETFNKNKSKDKTSASPEMEVTEEKQLTPEKTPSPKDYGDKSSSQVSEKLMKNAPMLDKMPSPTKHVEETISSVSSDSKVTSPTKLKEAPSLSLYDKKSAPLFPKPPSPEILDIKQSSPTKQVPSPTKLDEHVTSPVQPCDKVPSPDSLEEASSTNKLDDITPSPSKLHDEELSPVKLDGKEQEVQPSEGTPSPDSLDEKAPSATKLVDNTPSSEIHKEITSSLIKLVTKESSPDFLHEKPLKPSQLEVDNKTPSLITSDMLPEVTSLSNLDEKFLSTNENEVSPSNAEQDQMTSIPEIDKIDKDEITAHKAKEPNQNIISEKKLSFSDNTDKKELSPVPSPDLEAKSPTIASSTKVKSCVKEEDQKSTIIEHLEKRDVNESESPNIKEEKDEVISIQLDDRVSAREDEKATSPDHKIEVVCVKSGEKLSSPAKPDEKARSPTPTITFEKSSPILDEDVLSPTKIDDNVPLPSNEIVDETTVSPVQDKRATSTSKVDVKASSPDKGDESTSSPVLDIKELSPVIGTEKIHSLSSDKEPTTPTEVSKIKPSEETDEKASSQVQSKEIMSPAGDDKKAPSPVDDDKDISPALEILDENLSLPAISDKKTPSPESVDETPSHAGTIEIAMSPAKTDDNGPSPLHEEQDLSSSKAVPDDMKTLSLTKTDEMAPCSVHDEKTSPDTAEVKVHSPVTGKGASPTKTDIKTSSVMANDKKPSSAETDETTLSPVKTNAKDRSPVHDDKVVSHDTAELKVQSPVPDEEASPTITDKTPSPVNLSEDTSLAFIEEKSSSSVSFQKEPISSKTDTGAPSTEPEATAVTPDKANEKVPGPVCDDKDTSPDSAMPDDKASLYARTDQKTSDDKTPSPAKTDEFALSLAKTDEKTPNPVQEETDLSPAIKLSPLHGESNIAKLDEASLAAEIEEKAPSPTRDEKTPSPAKSDEKASSTEQDQKDIMPDTAEVKVHSPISEKVVPPLKTDKKTPSPVCVKNDISSDFIKASPSPVFFEEKPPIAKTEAEAASFVSDVSIATPDKAKKAFSSVCDSKDKSPALGLRHDKTPSPVQTDEITKSLGPVLDKKDRKPGSTELTDHSPVPENKVLTTKPDDQTPSPVFISKDSSSATIKEKILSPVSFEKESAYAKTDAEVVSSVPEDTTPISGIADERKHSPVYYDRDILPALSKFDEKASIIAQIDRKTPSPVPARTNEIALSPDLTDAKAFSPVHGKDDIMRDTNKAIIHSPGTDKEASHQPSPVCITKDIISLHSIEGKSATLQSFEKETASAQTYAQTSSSVHTTPAKSEDKTPNSVCGDKDISPTLVAPDKEKSLSAETDKRTSSSVPDDKTPSPANTDKIALSPTKSDDKALSSLDGEDQSQSAKAEPNEKALSVAEIDGKTFSLTSVEKTPSPDKCDTKTLSIAKIDAMQTYSSEHDKKEIIPETAYIEVHSPELEQEVSPTRTDENTSSPSRVTTKSLPASVEEKSASLSLKTDVEAPSSVPDESTTTPAKSKERTPSPVPDGKTPSPTKTDELALSPAVADDKAPSSLQGEHHLQSTKADLNKKALSAAEIEENTLSLTSVEKTPSPDKCDTKTLSIAKIDAMQTYSSEHDKREIIPETAEVIEVHSPELEQEVSPTRTDQNTFSPSRVTTKSLSASVEEKSASLSLKTDVEAPSSMPNESTTTPAKSKERTPSPVPDDKTPSPAKTDELALSPAVADDKAPSSLQGEHHLQSTKTDQNKKALSAAAIEENTLSLTSVEKTPSPDKSDTKTLSIAKIDAMETYSSEQDKREIIPETAEVIEVHSPELEQEVSPTRTDQNTFSPSRVTTKSLSASVEEKSASLSLKTDVEAPSSVPDESTTTPAKSKERTPSPVPDGKTPSPAKTDKLALSPAVADDKAPSSLQGEHHLQSTKADLNKKALSAAEIEENTLSLTSVEKTPSPDKCDTKTLSIAKIDAMQTYSSEHDKREIIPETAEVIEVHSPELEQEVSPTRTDQNTFSPSRVTTKSLSASVEEKSASLSLKTDVEAPSSVPDESTTTPAKSKERTPSPVPDGKTPSPAKTDELALSPAVADDKAPSSLQEEHHLQSTKADLNKKALSAAEIEENTLSLTSVEKTPSPDKCDTKTLSIAKIDAMQTYSSEHDKREIIPETAEVIEVHSPELEQEVSPTRTDQNTFSPSRVTTKSLSASVEEKSASLSLKTDVEAPSSVPDESTTTPAKSKERTPSPVPDGKTPSPAKTDELALSPAVADDKAPSSLQEEHHLQSTKADLNKKALSAAEIEEKTLSLTSEEKTPSPDKSPKKTIDAKQTTISEHDKKDITSITTEVKVHSPVPEIEISPTKSDEKSPSLSRVAKETLPASVEEKSPSLSPKTDVKAPSSMPDSSTTPAKSEEKTPSPEDEDKILSPIENKLSPAKSDAKVLSPFFDKNDIVLDTAEVTVHSPVTNKRTSSTIAKENTPSPVYVSKETSVAFVEENIPSAVSSEKQSASAKTDAEVPRSVPDTAAITPDKAKEKAPSPVCDDRDTLRDLAEPVDIASLYAHSDKKKPSPMSDDITSSSAKTDEKTSGPVYDEKDLSSIITVLDNDLPSLQVNEKLTPVKTTDKALSQSHGEQVLPSDKTELNEKALPVAEIEKTTPSPTPEEKTPSPIKIDAKASSAEHDIKDITPDAAEIEVHSFSEEVLLLKSNEKTPVPLRVTKETLPASVVEKSPSPSLKTDDEAPSFAPNSSITTPTKSEVKASSPPHDDKDISSVLATPDDNASLHGQSEKKTLPDDETPSPAKTDVMALSPAKSDAKTPSPVLDEKDIMLDTAKVKDYTPDKQALPKKTDADTPSSEFVSAFVKEKSISPVSFEKELASAKTDAETRFSKSHDSSTISVETDEKAISSANYDRETLEMPDEKVLLPSQIDKKTPSPVFDDKKPSPDRTGEISHSSVKTLSPDYDRDDITPDKTKEKIHSPVHDKEASTTKTDVITPGLANIAKDISLASVEENIPSQVSPEKEAAFAKTDEKVPSPASADKEIAPALAVLDDKASLPAEADRKSPSPVPDEKSSLPASCKEIAVSSVNTNEKIPCSVEDEKDLTPETSKVVSPVPDKVALPSKTDEKTPSPVCVTKDTPTAFVKEKSSSPVSSKKEPIYDDKRKSPDSAVLDDKELLPVQTDRKTPSPVPDDKTPLPARIGEIALSVEKIPSSVHDKKDIKPDAAQINIHSPTKAQGTEAAPISLEGQTTSPVFVIKDSSTNSFEEKIPSPRSVEKETVSSETIVDAHSSITDDFARISVKSNEKTPSPIHDDKNISPDSASPDIKASLHAPIDKKTPSPVPDDETSSIAKPDEITLSSAKTDAKKPSSLNDQKDIIHDTAEVNVHSPVIDKGESPTKTDENTPSLVNVAKDSSPSSVEEKLPSPVSSGQETVSAKTVENLPISVRDDKEILPDSALAYIKGSIPAQTDKSPSPVSDNKIPSPTRTDEISLLPAKSDAKAPSPVLGENYIMLNTAEVKTHSPVPDKTASPANTDVKTTSLVHSAEETLPASVEKQLPGSVSSEKEAAFAEINEKTLSLAKTEEKKTSQVNDDKDVPRPLALLDDKASSSAKTDEETSSPVSDDKESSSAKTDEHALSFAKTDAKAPSAVHDDKDVRPDTSEIKIYSSVPAKKASSIINEEKKSSPASITPALVEEKPPSPVSFDKEPASAKTTIDALSSKSDDSASKPDKSEKKAPSPVRDDEDKSPDSAVQDDNASLSALTDKKTPSPMSASRTLLPDKTDEIAPSPLQDVNDLSPPITLSPSQQDLKSNKTKSDGNDSSAARIEERTPSPKPEEITPSPVKSNAKVSSPEHDQKDITPNTDKVKVCSPVSEKEINRTKTDDKTPNLVCVTKDASPTSNEEKSSSPVASEKEFVFAKPDVEVSSSRHEHLLETKTSEKISTSKIHSETTTFESTGIVSVTELIDDNKPLSPTILEKKAQEIKTPLPATHQVLDAEEDGKKPESEKKSVSTVEKLPSPERSKDETLSSKIHQKRAYSPEKSDEKIVTSSTINEEDIIKSDQKAATSAVENDMISSRLVKTDEIIVNGKAVSPVEEGISDSKKISDFKILSTASSIQFNKQIASVSLEVKSIVTELDADDENERISSPELVVDEAEIVEKKPNLTEQHSRSTEIKTDDVLHKEIATVSKSEKDADEKEHVHVSSSISSTVGTSGSEVYEKTAQKIESKLSTPESLIEEETSTSRKTSLTKESEVCSNIKNGESKLKDTKPLNVTVSPKDVTFIEERRSSFSDGKTETTKESLKKETKKDIHAEIDSFTQYTFTSKADETTQHEIRKRSLLNADKKSVKTISEPLGKLSSISTVDSGITDGDSLTHTMIHGSSSEDVSKEVSLEEKYSFESTEKGDKHKNKTPLDDSISYDSMQSVSSYKLDHESEDISLSSTLKETDVTKTSPDDALKKATTTSSGVGSPKEEIPLSEASDSGVHSIPTDNTQKIVSTGDHSVSDTMKDSQVHLLESIKKAFGDESVQQGIKSESIESLPVHVDLDRVSTPPTVPVSPLPKAPSSFQDVKMSEGVQSEISYDKSDGAEETITKVVHVGDDVLTQKISTFTEKVPKTIKSAIEVDRDELVSLMQNMGKIKTETDTITKIIKEGENVVTQTITTVTTKEIISREDGTPQNVKTTIETTTLSKGSDGSVNTTTDTQTLLSECSSSLRSTSQMDMNAKDSRIETGDDKSESISSSQSRDSLEKSYERESSFVSKDVSETQLKSRFITETDECDDNIEDTVINTDVTKRIIKENNVDIMETVTTVTKKETLKTDENKTIVKTTVETNITKEHPDGTKDIQKNVEVKTEEFITDSSSNLDKILSEYAVYSKPEESVSTITEDVKQDQIVIKRVKVTRVVKTTYADGTGHPKKIKTETIVTTTDTYPDGSSQSKVESSTSLSDIESDDIFESPELAEFTIVEDKSEEVDKQEKTVIINGKNVKQIIITTTTKEILSNEKRTQKKLKTTIETITEDHQPDGVTQITRDIKVSVSDFDLETEEESFKGFDQVDKAKEDTTSEIVTVTENGLVINRKTTVTTITQEYRNVTKGVKRTKITIKTVTEDEHPDGSVITKTNEKVSLVDENLVSDVSVEEGSTPTDDTIKESDKGKDSPDKKTSLVTMEAKTSAKPEISKSESEIEVALKDLLLTPEKEPEETETIEKEEFTEDDVLIRRTIVTRITKTYYLDSQRIARKLKTIKTIQTTDQYPDGSFSTSVDTSTIVSDIEVEDTDDRHDLKGFPKTEDRSVNVEKSEKVIERDGQQVNQIITTTTTKEILLSEDESKKKMKTTTEVVTETKLVNGSTEVTKDVRISVADYGIDTFDDSLEGFIKIGDPVEHTTTSHESVIEKGVTIKRKTTVTTVRQEFENKAIHSKKIKTVVRTVVEDEHPDGSVLTKKSEKVSIADVFLKTPPPTQDEYVAPPKASTDKEIIKNITEESDTKKEIVQQGSMTINRTITTKTQREILASGDKNVKLVRTTVETTTVDEHPDGSTETTKDVKITISESQKTSDSNLQAALQGLKSTGKFKTSEDKKTNLITEEDEEITQTITTFCTKEEFRNDETNEIAVKTVTETITENAKGDGSIETTKDVRTQITYLPNGTSLDDWSPEELDEVEKQPTSHEKPKVGELPLKSQEGTKPDTKSKKSRTPIGEITTDVDTYTKVVQDGDNEITQTITVVTTKEVISPEKVKITVETTTVSKGSDGVTKTTKSTKTTISEYSEFKEEFEETIDAGESEKSSKYSSTRTGDMRSSSAASEDMDHPGISTPPSDISSRGSRAATHVWGTESSGMYYSDDDGPGSPSSTKSQIAHSPRSNLSFELDTKLPQQRDTSQETLFEKHDLGTSMLQKDPMSTSVYGQLLEDDSCTSSTHSEAKTEIHVSEKSVSKLTEKFLAHEKLKSEHSLKSEQTTKSDTSFLKEADEHFEKAIEEHKKVSGSDVISNITAKYEFDHSQTSSHIASSKEESSITLKDLKSESKKVTESSSSSSKQESKSEEIEHSRAISISKDKDPIESWGKPLGLPSPIMPPTQDGKGTPKKTAPSSTVLNKNKINQEKSKEAKSRASESPSKKKAPAPVYLELTYVPHHGNSYYSALDFFKRVRARYYVFSGTEPAKEIYNALLDAKKTWEDKDLEVTIIPTYDTDVLGYWVTENEEALEKYKIDLSPSASRCTINLQDHETSCAAYRLEF